MDRIGAARCRTGRFVKYTNNRINSDENYAWRLDCKHRALVAIHTPRICAFPLEEYLIFFLEEATRQTSNVRSRGVHVGVTMWPQVAAGERLITQ